MGYPPRLGTHRGWEHTAARAVPSRTRRVTCLHRSGEVTIARRQKHFTNDSVVKRRQMILPRIRVRQSILEPCNCTVLFPLP